MADKKLTFMNSLKKYIVTNGICEFELEDIYNMVCKSVYYGVFLKILNELRILPVINRFDFNTGKTVNFFDNGTGTTVLSAIDSDNNAKHYFEEKSIAYHFKDNVHYIEVKQFPCSVLCRGNQAGYNKKWIELSKMVVDCSFSFNSIYRPLSFSYKVDHLKPQEQYINVRNFNNLSMVLFQPDFQEDISMLVVKSGINGNIVSKKDVFTSLKFVQRISEEILSGACSYLVAPVRRAKDRIDSMPEEVIFNKIVDSVSNDCVALSQISRSSGIAKNIVLMTLCYIQNEINRKAQGIHH